MSLPNTLIITYQYEELPAPHSYIKEFKITKDKNQYKIVYTLTYTGREGLSLQEIEDEGYSENDDENWVGILPTLWVEAFTHIRSKKSNNKPYPINFIEVKEDDKVVSIKGYENELDYFIQELTQALYEIGGAEKPLEIKFSFPKNNRMHVRILNVSFAERKANVLDNNKKMGTIHWEQLPDFLELIYLMDFNEGYKNSKLPKESVACIEPGDGYWYKLEMLKKTISKAQFEKLESLLVKYIEVSAN